MASNNNGRLDPALLASSSRASAPNLPELDGLFSMAEEDVQPARYTRASTPSLYPQPQQTLPAGTLQLVPSSSVPTRFQPQSQYIPGPAPQIVQPVAHPQHSNQSQSQPSQPTQGEDDDDLGFSMADDDYSAQQTYQTQSKDNLKILMDNFSPEQYDRFEAYRRQGLSKTAVRKVIQQQVNSQVSVGVAQIVAGFSKVFVGEIIEKARAVQARRGETGPLSPDHLREAYRAYENETGRVGSARPLRGKKLFVR